MYVVNVDGREVLSGFQTLGSAIASRRSIAATLPKSVVEVTRDPLYERRSFARWGDL